MMFSGIPGAIAAIVSSVPSYPSQTWQPLKVISLCLGGCQNPGSKDLYDPGTRFKPSDVHCFFQCLGRAQHICHYHVPVI